MQAEFQMSALQDAIESVLHAASTDPERPSLSAVCLDTTGLAPKVVATDGAWIAERKFEATAVAQKGKVAIALDRAKKLVAMLGDEVGSVHVASDDKLIRFDLEKVGRVDCAPVENFPPYDDVWPKGDGQRISRLAMNPKLLTKISKAFRCRKGNGISFLFFGENSPILVNSESIPEMRAAVMPLKQLALEFDGAAEKGAAKVKANGKSNGSAKTNGHAKASPPAALPPPVTLEHRGQKLTKTSKNKPKAKGKRS